MLQHKLQRKPCRFIMIGKRDMIHESFTLQALDLVPTKIHQRSPVFLGSYDDVEEIKALYAAEEKKA